MPVDNEIPSHLNIRMDAKLRYLADLGARKLDMTLTQFIERALQESFAKISLDEFPCAEFDEEPNVMINLSQVERQERFAKRQETIRHPLSKVGDRLWSEHPFLRIQLLKGAGFDHLMNAEETLIFDYVVSHKFKTKNVIERWAQIKKDALSKGTK